MATRKCGNIYFRKYFMAVRTDRQWLLPNVNRQKMSPPIIKPVKKKFFINGIRDDLFGYQSAT